LLWVRPDVVPAADGIPANAPFGNDESEVQILKRGVEHAVVEILLDRRCGGHRDGDCKREYASEQAFKEESDRV